MLTIRKFQLLLAFTLSCTIAILWLYWSYLLASMEDRRHQALALAQRNVTVSAEASALQVEGILREIDFVLSDLRSVLLTERSAFPAAVERIGTLFPTEQRLAVWVIDARGQSIYSSLGPYASIEAENRDYFRELRDHGDADPLFIDRPLVGQYTKQWLQVFARRLQIDGKFAGVILLTVPPSYFSSRMRMTDPDLSVTIVHLPEGEISAVIKGEGVIGQPYDEKPPPLPSDATAVVAYQHEAGGREQLVAWNRVDGSRLVVAVSSFAASILDPLEASVAAEIRSNIVTTVMAVLLLLSFSFIAMRDNWLHHRLIAQQGHYKRLFDAMPDGMMALDANNDITLWNESALGLLGVDEEGLRQRRTRLYDLDGHVVPIDRYPSMNALDNPGHQGLYSVNVGGAIRWLSFTSRPLPTEPGTPSGGAILAFNDVTRLLQLEQSMRTSQSVFDVSSEGIMVTDADQRIVSVNPAFTTITGFPQDEALGRRPGDLLRSGAHDRAFYDQMLETLNNKGYWEGEITNRRKDGSIFIEWLKINVVRDNAGQIHRFVALLSDISERKRQDQEIWRRANYDPLTALPNRTLFMDRLGQAIGQAQRHNGRVGVLFIDLDKFKPVNDTLGHRAGDDLLIQVAGRIEACVRSEDTAARIGGDEFVVLIPRAGDDSSLLALAERVRTALATPFDLSGHTVQIYASIGIAEASLSTADPAQAIKRADAAMYQAKRSGGNRVTFL